MYKTKNLKIFTIIYLIFWCIFSPVFEIQKINLQKAMVNNTQVSLNRQDTTAIGNEGWSYRTGSKTTGNTINEALKIQLNNDILNSGKVNEYGIPLATFLSAPIGSAARLGYSVYVDKTGNDPILKLENKISTSLTDNKIGQQVINTALDIGIWTAIYGAGNRVENKIGNVIGNAKGDSLVYGSDTKSYEKLVNQMDRRGWTKEMVEKTVNKPFTTRISINKANGNNATVYYTKKGSYVVIDDVTKEVIQISNNINPQNWFPDPEIINPYIPKRK